MKTGTLEDGHREDGHAETGHGENGLGKTGLDKTGLYGNRHCINKHCDNGNQGTENQGRKKGATTMNHEIKALRSKPAVRATRWAGGMAVAAVASVLGGCRSSGAIGLTDCYGVFRIDVATDQYRFHGSGVRAEVLDPDCPPLKKVECRFWDDRDGDQELDPGEQLARGVFAEANPPSHVLTSGSFSGRRAGVGRATCWECEVINSSNEVSRFGGMF